MAALILCLGDAFHLIPRMLWAWDAKKDYTKLLGVGKLITSLTMTLFYMLLWQAGLKLFDEKILLPLTVVLYVLALLRTVLCVLPQNKWTQNETSLKWSAARNISFFAMGALVTALFAAAQFQKGAYPYLWLALAISFACYIPVVFLSHKYKKTGMLILPKSLAYIAAIVIALLYTA